MSRQSLFLCLASPYTAEQQAATSQKSQLRNSYSEKKMRESMFEGAYATKNQNWGKLETVASLPGLIPKIARQEQGESTWDPLNASELAANSANGLIPSLIAWAKSKPPGNVARVSRITANIHGLHRSDDRRSCPIRRGMLALSCLVSVGIKGIVLSLGLAGSVCAAGFPAQEPPPGGLSATLLPSNTPQEVAGILVSAPPANPSDRATNPATLQGQEPSDRTDRVSSNAQDIPPSIVPLPLLGAAAASGPSSRPATSQYTQPACTWCASKSARSTSARSTSGRHRQSPTTPA